MAQGPHNLPDQSPRIDSGIAGAPVPPPTTSPRRIVGNAVAMLASDVVNRGTTFVLYALVGRFLGDYAFGQMSLALTLFYTFQIFAIAGLKTLITREVAKDRAKTDAYLINGSIAVILTSVAAMLVAIVLVRVLDYSPDTGEVIVTVSLALFPVALIAITEAIFLAWERMHFIAIVNGPVNVVKIIATFAFLSGGYGLPYLIGVLIASYALILVIEWLFILRFITRPALRPDVRFMVRMLRQTTTFLGIDAIIAIATSFSIVLLSKVASEREVGLVGAATQFLTPLQVIYQNVVVSLFPLMCRKLEPGLRGLRAISENLIEILVAFGLPAMLGIFILADRALVFLYGQESFADGTLVLRIFSVTVLFRAIIHALGQTLIAGMHERDTLRIVLVGIVMNIVLSVVLISQFGMVGAAVAGLILGVIDLALHLHFITRMFGATISLVRAMWRAGLAGAVMTVFLLLVLPSARDYFIGVVLSAGALYLVALAAIFFVSVGNLSQIRARYLEGITPAEQT
jgi:O-antigen/teichoic acid export membrane protein